MTIIEVEVTQDIELAAQAAGKTVSEYIHHCIDKTITSSKIKQSRMPAPDINVFQIYYDHGKNKLVEALEQYDHKELCIIARTTGLRAKDYIHVKDVKKLAVSIADKVESIATRGDAFALPEHRVNK